MNQSHDALPPMKAQGLPSAPGSGNTSAITPVKAEEPQLGVEEPERSPRQEKAEEKDRDGDVRMQIDEPAMRQIEVNEDYDEPSEEERPNGAAPGSQKSQQGSGANSGQASPKVVVAPTSVPVAGGQKAEA